MFCGFLAKCLWMQLKNIAKGVLIVNTGSPSSNTSKAIRTYLEEFLKDKRIIKIPRIIWLPILYLIILPVRPKRKVKDYNKIWMEEGSPLLVISERLLRKIKSKFSSKNIFFRMAMNYGKPSIKEELEAFKKQNINQLTILPLFPQFSFSTTQSVIDRVNESLIQLDWQPKLKIIKEYYENDIFIDSLSKKIANEWKINGKNDLLIFTYHGLPKKYINDGDTYYQACLNTSRLVANKLKLSKKKYITSFHSKFGFGEWTKPYTEDLLKKMPKNGNDSIDIISPTFSVDCLETLEEIAIQFKNEFIEAGGREFNYIPCLNDSDDQINLIENLIT